MLRTQISLTEGQKRQLDAESAKTGLSLSELIRRAIDRCYRRMRDLDADLEAIQQAAGAWQDRDFDGEEYVERLRPGRRPER
ncbi:MAG: ribbon-helix-helix protein, CopG family [Egibacteraceae bacterium]